MEEIIHGKCIGDPSDTSGPAEESEDIVKTEPLVTGTQVSAGKEVGACLSCGLPGANISAFSRIGNASLNTEPLINMLSCIVKKSTVDIHLYSDVVCMKCFQKFEYIEKLQYQLAEAYRDVTRTFNKALKLFMKSSTSTQFEDPHHLLVLNDINLKDTESGIIGRALSVANTKKILRRNEQKPERKHKCSVCGKSFHAFSHRVEHMVIHTREKSFKCDICGFSTTTKSNLSKHREQHIYEYFCNICNKKLSNKFSLKEHMLTHSSDKSYQCDYCDKRFLRHRDKKVHEKSHFVHENGPYECKVCQKRFVLKSRLSRHMLIHCKEKEFVCSVCKKRFARKDDLKCHERIHTGDKPYECKECGKQFRFISNCRNHMKTHSKEAKLYRCTYCNISFLTEGKYNSHLKTRNHKRKLSEVSSLDHIYCDGCKTSFPAGDYSLHRPVCEKNMNGERQKEQIYYTYCDVCGVRFDNIDQLSEHTLHSHVEQGVLSQGSETGVIITSVVNDANVVSLKPIDQYSVTGESVNMVVSVDNEDVSLEVPLVEIMSFNSSSAELDK